MSRFLDKLLETPMFAFDHLMVFADVLSFLEFSEENIESQKENALLKAESEVDGIEEEYRFDYRRQKLEAVHFRFDVALPMRVRYAALTAFTSTVEWSVMVLRPSFKLPKVPPGKSEPVHRLIIFSERCGLNLSHQIHCFEFLTWIRNSIMHNAGALKGYRHESAIRSAISDFAPNFVISNWHHIGDTVEIKRGALEPLINGWRETIQELHTRATQRGLVVFEKT